MKESEIIRKYYSSIWDAMVEKYRIVLECDGRVQYKIFVWEDGELEYLQGPQGDNATLRAKDYETRELVYVATVDAPCFDAWDFTQESPPDDEDEREAQRAEIIDYIVEEYDHETVRCILDDRIEECEREERWEKETFGDDE